MKAVIPEIVDGLNFTFIRLGKNEDIDMAIDLKTRTVTFERIHFDETNDEWVGDEIYASEIEDDMDYEFHGIHTGPLTFREVRNIFSHKMFLA